MREGACIGAATMLQPWTLRLILNVEVDAALAAASPTWARLSADGILVHMTKPFFSTHLESGIPFCLFEERRNLPQARRQQAHSP